MNSLGDTFQKLLLPLYPTILTIINVTVFVKLNKLLNHRTADLFTFDVFVCDFFFSASCGIPFQALPDYQEGAEHVRN